jgi:hypothetical protein
VGAGQDGANNLAMSITTFWRFLADELRANIGRDTILLLVIL